MSEKVRKLNQNEIQNLISNDAVVDSINEETRMIRFIAIREQVNRNHHVVLTSAWDFTNFLKNPVFLYCHDRSSLPIGEVRNIFIQAKDLVIDVYFSKEYEFADQVYRLYKEGILKGVSVGFLAKEFLDSWNDEDRKVIADKYPEYADADFIVTKADLWEVSGVSIPADPDALIKYNSVHPNSAIDKIIKDYKSFKALNYEEETKPRVKAYGNFLKDITNILDIERGSDEQVVLDNILLKVKDLHNSISHFQNTKSNSAEETPKQTETPDVIQYNEMVADDLVQKVLQNGN